MVEGATSLTPLAAAASETCSGAFWVLINPGDARHAGNPSMLMLVLILRELMVRGGRMRVGME